MRLLQLKMPILVMEPITSLLEIANRANLSSLYKFQRYRLPILSIDSRFPRLTGLYLAPDEIYRTRCANVDPMQTTMTLLCVVVTNDHGFVAHHSENTSVTMGFTDHKSYFKWSRRLETSLWAASRRVCLKGAQHITLIYTWPCLLSFRSSQQPAMTKFLFGYAILRAAFQVEMASAVEWTPVRKSRI